MKKLFYAAVVLFTLSVGPVFSQDEPAAASGVSPEHVEAIQALFDVMNIEETMSATMGAGLDPQLEQMRQMGIGQDALVKMKAEMVAFLEEVMAWDTLEDEMIQIYADAFSVDELNTITAFYKTPAGQKVVATMPELNMKGMMLGQKRVQENMPKLQARIMPIIQAEQAKQQ